MPDANSTQACRLRDSAALPWQNSASRGRASGLNETGPVAIRDCRPEFPVGVLTDYFRAPDAKSAARAMELPAGPLLPEPAFDGVEAKRIDPCVVLGQLVALIRGVPWDVHLVRTVMVWPLPETKPATKEAYNALPEASPWKQGPWLEELEREVRDALATVDDARLPALADQWARIEEFHRTMSAEVALSLINDLVGLARRARDAGDRLYCWISL
jgi:hypothetical protein